MFSKLKDRPLKLSLLGWGLFIGMYFLVGVFTIIGLSVQFSFVLASPAGAGGFCCWLIAFTISITWLVSRKNCAIALGALISSTFPMALLITAFGIAANGGV
ncbi:MAG: hypothetical protein KTR16_14705 [Acidiferrobacterales bacterium]|nr:hypothetical protein [Acidiferrobacterales bacterium]